MCGDVKVQGLLDAESATEFDSPLQAVGREMDEQKKQLRLNEAPAFHKCLTSHAVVMKISMILGERIAVGLTREES